MLVSSDPASLLRDRGWLKFFGAHRVEGLEDYGMVQSLRVYFGDLEVEFGIAGKAWVELPLDDGTAGVMRDPMILLHDPGELLAAAIDFARAAGR